MAAKFVVVACWSAVLVALAYGLSLAVGHAIGLPGWSTALAANTAEKVAVVGSLTIGLVAPFALVASAGRGYLPPVGFMFLIVFLSQALSVLG